METFPHFFLELKQRLPAESWLWVLTGLRRDPVVWRALSDPALIKTALERLPASSQSWSPGALALLALDSSLRIDELRASPMKPLPVELRKEAIQAYKDWRNQEQAPDLHQSGLLALALREHRRMKDTWEGLSATCGPADERWLTPVACLLGMIPDRQALLRSLLSTHCIDMAARLVLHALFSNPAPLQEQMDTIDALLESTSPERGLLLLSEMSKDYPEQASQLAQRYTSGLSESWQAAETVSGEISFDQPSSQVVIQQMEDLKALVLLSDAHNMADRRVDASMVLEQARRSTRRLEGHLAALYAQTVERSATNRDSQAGNIALEAWKRAVELAPETSQYAIRLAACLTTCSSPEDAQVYLSGLQANARFNGSAKLSLLAMRLAERQDLQDEAQEAALEALKCVKSGDELDRQDWEHLARFLLDNDLFEQAMQATELGLEHYRLDRGLLTMHAQAALAEGAPEQALPSIAIALGTMPGDDHAGEPASDHSGLVNLWIECLETLGAWQIALAERSAQIAQMDQPSTQDLLALAACALHAGDIDLVFQVCQQALESDPDEGAVHGVLAEAYLAREEFPEALSHYRQALSAMPAREDWWLALVELYRRLGQEKEALDTLRAAAQALPDRPQVHLALGEAYLDGDAPTLALSSLRQAARIDSSPRVVLRLGQALQRLGHLGEARHVLQHAYEGCYLPGQADGEANSIRCDRELFSQLAHTYAQVLVALDETPAAVPVLESAIQAGPAQPALRLAYAQSLLRLGADVAEDKPQAFQYAIEVLRPVLEDSEILAPAANRVEAQAALAELYEAVEEWQLSADAYQEALRTSLADKPEWRKRLSLGLGRVTIQLGKPELATDALRQAMRLSPADVDLPIGYYRVCLACGQVQDAWEAATALRDMRPSDLDTLIWFAEQAAQLAETEEGAALEARQASIEAYHSCVQLAPERGDLLLRLGGLYLQARDLDQAEQALNKLVGMAQLSGVDVAELYQAAQALRGVGMSELASAILERALEQLEIDLENCQAPPLALDLYAELASVYCEVGNYQAALQVLEEAIRLSPESKAFYLEKADILFIVQRFEEARLPLASALRLDPEDATAHYQKARLESLLGDLPNAYYHAVQAICRADEGQDREFLRLARLQAAELSHISLRPRQARAYLWDEPADEIENEASFTHYILLSELALDDTDLVTASQMVEKAAESAPDDVRTLAAQARLMRLQGHHRLGNEQMDRLIKGIGKLERSLEAKGPGKVRLLASCYRSACRATWDYDDWDQAYRLVCKAASYGNHEPLSMFLKAQFLASRAERTRRLTVLDVQQHVPVAESLSGEAGEEFQAAILEAERQVQAIGVLEGEGEESLWGDEAYQALRVWRARGNAVFYPTLEHALALQAALKGQPVDHQALTALIMAYQAAGESARAVQAVRADWPSAVEHPFVMLHMALALEDTDLMQAFEVARSARRSAMENGCPDCPDAPTLAYLVARLAFRVGEYPLAHEAILAAVREWPEEARWHALAASIYLVTDPEAITTINAEGSEDLQAKALEHLEQAVELEPDNVSHQLHLGQIYRQTGAIQRAIAAFEQATQLAPDQPQPWFELAQTQVGNGDLQAADASAARALAHAPDDLEVLMLNASIAMKRENLNGALRHLKAILRLKPDHPQALKLLSGVLDGLGRTDEALEVLDKSLPLLGNPLELQLQQTRLLYRARGAEAAMPRLQNLIDRFPQEPELLATQAEWLFQNGETRQAIERARSALAEDRGKLPGRRRADLYYLIGLHARQEGQLDQAVHALSEAVASAPDHLEALLALGRTHQSRRELHQAWKVYQRAVDLTPHDYRPYYYAGQVLKDLKDYVQAEKMLRHAAHLAPDEVLVHRLLGAVTVLNLVHNRPAVTTEPRS